MKKSINLLCAGVLMSALCAGFVACNEPTNQNQNIDEPTAEGTLPVDAADIPENVAVFFDENPNIFSDFLETFDKYDDTGNFVNVCFTINRMAELEEIVPSGVEFPHIDFEKYTLVVGQYVISGGDAIISQSIYTEPDTMKLNLKIKNSGQGVAAMFWVHYCSLYPKLPLKPIDFEVTIYSK